MYQATDPQTNAVIGLPNTPVDIAPGASQSYVIALTPTDPFDAADVVLAFEGSNTYPVTPLVGINTLLLSASPTPVPDIVALAATLSNDGIVNIPGTDGTGIFAVATVNLGASGSITATTDTGAGSPPVTIALCQTDPGQGFCLQPPGSSVTTQIDGGQTPDLWVLRHRDGHRALRPGHQPHLRPLQGRGRRDTRGDERSREDPVTMSSLK